MTGGGIGWLLGAGFYSEMKEIEEEETQRN